MSISFRKILSLGMLVIIGLVIMSGCVVAVRRPPRPVEIVENYPPRPAHSVWVKGYWKWNDSLNQWVWAKGHWSY
jgi:hypothetical protein